MRTEGGEEAERDTSWFLIAVGRRKVSGYRDCVVLDYAEGWEDFAVEFYWEDTFACDPPMHLTPGAYRWSGYQVGFWGEDDHLNVKGGSFEPYTPNPHRHTTTPADTTS